jgi:hypothetical protein
MGEFCTFIFKKYILLQSFENVKLIQTSLFSHSKVHKMFQDV